MNLSKRSRGSLPADLKGQTFYGNLAVEPAKNCNGHWKWLFECSCGKRFTALGSKVVNGHTRSCGCLRRRTWQKYSDDQNKKYAVGRISKRFFSGLKHSAAIRGIPFCLSHSDVAKTFDESGDKCALSDLPIHTKLIRHNWGENVNPTASLDRIDSKKGYTSDNIQWVHKDINMMKQDYNQDYYLALSWLVSKKFQQKVLDSIGWKPLIHES